MESRYPDPILGILADLKVVYDAAAEEVIKLRQLLNQQNESMVEMQREIDQLRDQRARYEMPRE